MTDQEQGAKATLRLLWGPRPKPSRGPKPGFSLERIAAAGIEAAVADGLPAVSMQRVAGLLGVTKMALYRYVPGKAELVALMVEQALAGDGEGGVPGPGPDSASASDSLPASGATSGSASGPASASGDWRAALDRWARELAGVFTRHPWLLDATVGPRVPGPAELAWMERVVAALDGTGLTGAERMDAAVLLTGHVRGIAQQARASGDEGDTEARLTAAMGEVLREHGAGYPALAAAFASTAADGGQDQALDFGLARILDGLALLIEARAR